MSDSTDRQAMAQEWARRWPIMLGIQYCFMFLGIHTLVDGVARPLLGGAGDAGLIKWLFVSAFTSTILVLILRNGTGRSAVDRSAA